MSESIKISCIAVDDEPPALNVIQRHISLIPSLDLVASCNSAVEALELLRSSPVDLMFMDIKMPVILGTDFVRNLKNPPRVIFTSAYRKFALEGFELNAVDYLLKPISFERFLQAVSKLMDRNLHVTGHDPSLAYPKDSLDAFIYFRADRKMIKVALSEILYVESLKDYIKVFTPSRVIITKQSISSLEEMLPPSSFLRIHRSFLVNIGRIDSFRHDQVEIGDKELPVSRLYRQAVMGMLSTKEGHS